MRIKLLSLITGLLALGLLAYFIATIYELKDKTYYVDEAKLYKIGTFHLLGKAYEKAKYVNKYSKGFEGFAAFDAKTKLIQHYEKTLGAYRFGVQRMIIPTQPAQILIDKYFKN